MKIKFESNENYCYFFDYETGRNLTIEKTNFFLRKKGPNLLDVSITNRCNRNCDFCYRQSHINGEDISVDDYKLIIKQAKDCGVQQIAIGGGEPTIHPEFVEILRITKENGIIPNYSTNGDNLNDTILDYTQKYCGAIAISIYDNISNYESIVLKLTEHYNIKVNLHFILRKDKIEAYTSLLKNPPDWFNKLNSIIFLNYKPANGNQEICLKNVNCDMLQLFFNSVKNFNCCGIGFDTCSVSFICKYLNIDTSIFDFCEAGRKSAFINEKLDVSPCSFYTNKSDNLNNESLKKIWTSSKIFHLHRIHLSKINRFCNNFVSCHNGCPIYEINACNECIPNTK